MTDGKPPEKSARDHVADSLKLVLQKWEDRSPNDRVSLDGALREFADDVVRVVRAELLHEAHAIAEAIIHQGRKAS